MRLPESYYWYLFNLQEACWEHNIEEPKWLQNAMEIYRISSAGWGLFQRAGNNAIPKKIMEWWSGVKPMTEEMELSKTF